MSRSHQLDHYLGSIHSQDSVANPALLVDRSGGTGATAGLSSSAQPLVPLSTAFASPRSALLD